LPPKEPYIIEVTDLASLTELSVSFNRMKVIAIETAMLIATVDPTPHNPTP